MSPRIGSFTPSLPLGGNRSSQNRLLVVAIAISDDGVLRPKLLDDTDHREFDVRVTPPTFLTVSVPFITVNTNRRPLTHVPYLVRNV